MPRTAPAGVRPVLPLLTVLYHPDLGRVGERAWLGASARLEVGREQPLFAQPDGGTARALECSSPGAPVSSPGAPVPLGVPLGDAAIARHALRIEIGEVGEGSLSCSARGAVVVDGEPLRRPRIVGAGDVDAGLVLELGGVVLLLHRQPFGEPRAPALGMVGESPALHQLRFRALRLAALRKPVLLLGESGSGKELVAAAIHTAGPRARGPFVKVDMATLAPDSAARALCGSEPARSYLGAADGGTLFLDEIAEAPLEAQRALLGVLDGRGSRRARPLDVRLVAATDANVALAVRRGRLLPALVDRLGGRVLRVPPLRDRREDIGRLLVRFLRDELAALDLPHRLRTAPGARPWLPAWVVAAAARHRWPGNVRELRDFARQLAAAEDVGRSAALERVLAVGAPPSEPVRSATRARRRASSADGRAVCGARARGPSR